MKEVQVKEKDQIAIVKQAEQHARETVLFGTIKSIKGTKLYEYNLETNEMKEVILEMPPKNISSDKKLNPIRLKANYNPKCLYVRAINFKNAVRKLKSKLPNINPKIIK